MDYDFIGKITFTLFFFIWNVIEGFKDARTKSQGFAKQACDVAAKMKKMQEEGAAGGGMGGPPPRLPAGPL